MILSEPAKINNKLMNFKELFRFSHTSSPSTSLRSTGRPPTPASYDAHKSAAMEEAIINSEPIITKWDPDSSEFNRVTWLFRNAQNESSDFLNSVNELRRAMDFFISENSTSAVLIQAQKLMLIAMRRLEKEFYKILSENRRNLDPESISGSSADRSTSDEDTDDEFVRVAAELKSIADCMINCGYGKECIKIYKKIRKSIVDETLFRFGTEKFKISKIQRRNWDSIEQAIKNWMNTLKIAVNTLFRGEKFLCDQVFSISPRIRESCFSDITKDGAITMFKFPELVAKGKKDSDKIFLLIELYQVHSYVLPEIDSIFDSVSTSAVKAQAHTSMTKLADSIRETLNEFELSIQRDSSRTPEPGGGIHPLTRSAMNYISSLADYNATLSEILPAGKSQIPASYMETNAVADGLSSAVAAQIGWLILVLLCKLDTKAKLYKDVSLSYLFLANNLNNIVRTAAATNLRTVMGREWAANHRSKVKMYAAKYEAAGWKRVMGALEEKGSPENSAEVFRKFNAAFEEAYRKQASWRVEEGKLRDELKISIGKKLIPMYRVFYEGCVEKEVGVERGLLSFTPHDLGNYLSDLFHGVSSSSPGSTSSSLSSFGSL